MKFNMMINKADPIYSFENEYISYLIGFGGNFSFLSSKFQELTFHPRTMKIRKPFKAVFFFSLTHFFQII